MNCEEARELIEAAALGALAPVEARALEAHLTTCAGCRAAHAEAEQTAAYLALAAPARRAGPALRSRVMSRVRGRTAGVAAMPRVWAAAAAVLLAVSLGAISWNVVLQGDVNDLESNNDRLMALAVSDDATRVSLVATQQALVSNQEAMQAAFAEQQVALGVALDTSARPFPMDGVGEASEAIGSYVWSSQHQMGVLYAAKMPEPPDGAVYQVWLLTADRVVNGGTFVPAEDGSATVLVRDALPGGPVVAVEVSVEPGGGSAIPTGATVLHGQPAP